MRFRNTASVYNTCIITGFGALLTASKIYSNGRYKEMQKFKTEQNTEADLKEQKTLRTNTYIHRKLKQC